MPSSSPFLVPFLSSILPVFLLFFNIYVVVKFSSQVIFDFLLFLGICNVC